VFAGRKGVRRGTVHLPILLGEAVVRYELFDWSSIQGQPCSTCVMPQAQQGLALRPDREQTADTLGQRFALPRAAWTL